MARSSYVYIPCFDGNPHGAFTVKHELITWLSRTDRLAVEYVLRLPDGVPYGTDRGSAAFLMRGTDISQDPAIAPHLTGRR